MMAIEECNKLLPPQQDTMPPSFLCSKAKSAKDDGSNAGQDKNNDNSPSEDKDKTSEGDLTDLLDMNMKIGTQLTIKEREKIFIAAELIQKNYLELRKEQADLKLEKVIEVFIEKGTRLNPQVE